MWRKMLIFAQKIVYLYRFATLLILTVAGRAYKSTPILYIIIVFLYCFYIQRETFRLIA